jgi:hypothetical protein
MASTIMHTPTMVAEVGRMCADSPLFVETAGDLRAEG